MVLEEGRLSAVLVGDGSVVKKSDGIVEITSQKSPDYTGQVTIDEGLFMAQGDALPKANFRLRGGELRFGSADAVPNHFTLDGGAVNGGRLTGIIDVASDSVLLHEASTRIAGTLRGAASLTIRGRQDNRFTYSVALFGDASQFVGDFHAESGAPRIGHPGAAGSGDIDVHAAGLLQANNSSAPTLTVANDIDLVGGTLMSFPPSSGFGSTQAPASVVTGDVTVHGEAFIGSIPTGFTSAVRTPGLTLAGKVTLNDGAHVFGLSDGRSTIASGDVALVDISGDLVVGESVTWHLLSSSLSLSGAIRPAGARAAIDFVGGRDQLRLTGAEFLVEAGRPVVLCRSGVPRLAEGLMLHGRLRPAIRGALLTAWAWPAIPSQYRPRRRSCQLRESGRADEAAGFVRTSANPHPITSMAAQTPRSAPRGSRAASARIPAIAHGVAGVS
jgi:hypothetical protein